MDRIYMHCFNLAAFVLVATLSACLLRDMSFNLGRVYLTLLVLATSCVGILWTISAFRRDWNEHIADVIEAERDRIRSEFGFLPSERF